MKSNNLSTFKTLFLVKGILTLCFSLFFMLYAGMGLFFNNMINQPEVQNELPFDFGWIFVIIGGIGIILCVTIGIVTIMASKYIKALKNYNFIMVIAVINCLTGILGILLGVFAIIELNKPEVKQLFKETEISS